MQDKIGEEFKSIQPDFQILKILIMPLKVQFTMETVDSLLLIEELIELVILSQLH